MWLECMCLSVFVFVRMYFCKCLMHVEFTEFGIFERISNQIICTTHYVSNCAIRFWMANGWPLEIGTTTCMQTHITFKCQKWGKTIWIKTNEHIYQSTRTPSWNNWTTHQWIRWILNDLPYVSIPYISIYICGFTINVFWITTIGNHVWFKFHHGNHFIRDNKNQP